MTIVNLRAFTSARNVPLVVFVDMQQEYIAAPRLMAIPEIDRALANSRIVLDFARRIGLPIAFIRWADRSPFFNKATPFFRWIEGFEPQRNEMVFERGQPSCYSSREFAELIEQSGGQMVLVGFAGESACLSTMVDAFHRNHRVKYLIDASASHELTGMAADDVHFAISRVAALYGDVLTTGDWINSKDLGQAERGGRHVDNVR
jgi:nicotinamidase-related amidase